MVGVQPQNKRANLGEEANHTQSTRQEQTGADNGEKRKEARGDVARRRRKHKRGRHVQLNIAQAGTTCTAKYSTSGDDMYS